MPETDDGRVVVDFDHHSADVTAQVDDMGVGPVVKKLANGCPVAWTNAHDGYWLITGYDPLREISRHDDIFSSDHDPGGLRHGYSGVTIPPTYPVPLGFIEMDAPEHTLIRKALLPWFNQVTAEEWRPVVKDVVTAFIDRVIEDGECDFIEAIASPVPAVVSMMLLGAPLDRWKLWSDAHHRTTAAGPTGPERDRAVQEMAQVIGDINAVVSHYKQNPEEGEPSNLISLMCKTEIGGRLLPPEEVLLHAVLISAGGTDTTTSAFATALKWLDRHPEERERLRTGPPELMKTAVEEFVRISAPVTALARTAKSDYMLQGQQIAAGERVLMMYAAANHDQSVFPNPDVVDLERSPNPHTAFGLSAHRCIGMHFARVEMEIMLTEVLSRMPDYSVDHDRARRPLDVGVNQGWIELPMRFTPGPRLGSKFQPAEA